MEAAAACRHTLRSTEDDASPADSLFDDSRFGDLLDKKARDATRKPHMVDRTTDNKEGTLRKCYQFLPAMGHIGSEDCLYLHVTVPTSNIRDGGGVKRFSTMDKLTATLSLGSAETQYRLPGAYGKSADGSPVAKKKVMVWFHGGAFLLGDPYQNAITDAYKLWCATRTSSWWACSTVSACSASSRTPSCSATVPRQTPRTATTGCSIRRRRCAGCSAASRPLAEIPSA